MAAPGGRLPQIAPMLAAPARAVPANADDWAAEAKWDGARAIAYISGGTAVLRARSGSDVTSSYPEVAATLTRAAGRRTLILDGELTAFGDERPSFALLQRRLHVARPAPSLVAAVPVTFIAFDPPCSPSVTALPLDRKSMVRGRAATGLRRLWPPLPSRRRSAARVVPWPPPPLRQDSGP